MSAHDPGSGGDHPGSRDRRAPSDGSDATGSVRPRRRRGTRPLDIAIVGMACRFPGAPDLVTYWANLLAGTPAGAHGGLLDPVPFDPAALGLDPGEPAGAPGPLLVLEAARRALADAGLPAGLPGGTRVELIVGRGAVEPGPLAGLDASTGPILRALHPEWSEAQRAALHEAIRAGQQTTAANRDARTRDIAGRVAGWLKFRGAAFDVDAGRASALVALDLAARSLRERRADLALVGAVHLRSDREAAGADAGGASGPLRGEGVGVLVLKRLADAERDGHRVYAVLQGVGLAGARRGSGHALALRRAYQRSAIPPATVGLIEGHGPGDPAAEVAELATLRRVFPASDRRVLGSAGELVGTAEAAAGMAGVIKAALALHHRLLPGSPGITEPHPLLATAGAPVRRLPGSRPWVHGARPSPRRAGVSAGALGGLGAHAILEEHLASADDPTAPGVMPDWPTEAFLLGAPDRATWLTLAGALVDWLGAATGPVSLKDLAYTLNVRQPAFPFRVGLVAGTAAELKARLQQAIQRLSDPDCHAIRDGRGLYFRAQPLAVGGKVAFLFPGEGSQYPGMLADLYPHFPEIQRPFETADRLALDRGALPPSEILFGAEASTDPALWTMGPAVGLVLSAQWGLYQLLVRLGLRPDAVAGHSSGEFLALGAAGVTAIDRQFEERIAAVGDLFERLEASGAVPHAALLAVGTSRDRAEAACRAAGTGSVVAMDNCPHQVVLAVPPDRAEGLIGHLRAEGVACEALPFARAYHTPAFSAALGPIRRFFEELPLVAPRVPLYSCAIASRMPDDPARVRELAVAQWSSPVGFRPMIEAMYADGCRVFVEVGARGNLTGFVEDTLRDRPAVAVAANLPRRPGPTQLNHLAATLFAQGVTLRPDALYLRRRPVRLDLSEPPTARPELPSLALGAPALTLPETLTAALRSVAPVAVPAVARVEDSAPIVVPIEDLPPSPLPPVEPTAPAPPLVDSLPVAVPSEPADAAMLAYLRTMDEFLALQRDVMAAYAAQGAVETLVPGAWDAGGSIGPSGPGPVPRPAVVEPVPVPAVQAPERPPLAERLRARVAERTGYPIEMLRPELDLEADLGIDSIKRVEILGDLRDDGALPAGLDLDPLTRARTLHDLLALLAAAEPAARPTEETAMAEAEPVGPWVGTIQSLEPGVRLVAYRRLDLATDPVAAHHTIGGRRISAVDRERKGLPVVPFTVMAEMLAQAAAVLDPGRPVVALRDVRAHRWIKYEPDGVTLEIRAEREPGPDGGVRVAIFNRTADRAANAGPVVEGVVVHADRRPAPPAAPAWSLDQAGPSRFTAESLYDDQWLFHGPAFQALTHVGRSAPRGIEGTLTVLPRHALWAEGTGGRLRIDAIVLDAFTHLLGCWGLDQLREGEVIFPLRLAELAFYGDDPAEGTEVGCRIAVTDIEPHRVAADVQIVRPDGRLWMTIRGWEDWRFYWPNRFRDQFRAPDRVLVGEPIEPAGLPDGASLVWLQPPADFGRPIWRDVMEAVQLDPVERAAMHALIGPERRRTLRLWGRVAAKEAARRLRDRAGLPPIYPADLVIEPDRAGRPRLRSRLEPGRTDWPALSIAHTEGVALALAASDPTARVGVDVERIVARESGFEALAFSEPERRWIDRLAASGGDRAEWVARCWCAKEAAGKATGRGLLIGPASVTIVGAQADSGTLHLTLGPDLRAACPDWPAEPVEVHTARRDGYAWAWTVATLVADPATASAAARPDAQHHGDVDLDRERGPR